MYKTKETTETKVTYNGIGFVGLLTILFIALKLTGYITWSWWWVLSPLWISAIASVAMVVIVLAVVFVVAWVKDRRSRT